MALLDYGNKVIYWDEVNWQWLPYLRSRGSKDSKVFYLSYRGTKRRVHSSEDILRFLTNVGYSLQPLAKLGITELYLGCYLYNGKVYYEDGNLPIRSFSRLLS